MVDEIACAVDNAAQYGIVTQSDVTRFVEYTVIYGPGFDSKEPWATRILLAAGLSGAEKMDGIDDHDQFEMNRE